MITLFDYYHQESWDLHYSLLVSGYKHPTVVIHDDGFLPEDILSPYQFVTGFDKINGKPLYFNQLPVPELWEIRSTNQSGQVFEYDSLRARISYAKPSHKRFVKEVEWLDEQGRIFSLDRYNKQGYRFARVSYDLQGTATTTSYYNADNQEVLVENHITGDSILNKDGQILIFKSQTDFVMYYLKEAELDSNRILYNSLSTPFFVAHRLPHNGEDVLFWQETVRQDVPDNMSILLSNTHIKTRVAVQNWQAYERLKSLLSGDCRLSYQGYMYPLRRQNLARPSALILTNSDHIEQLGNLVESLPQLAFHIAALTEMSSKLLRLAAYANVTVYPNMTDSTLSQLLKTCDIYLDINYGDEIVSAVRAAFEQAMLIFSFSETQHQTKYIAPQNVFAANDVADMIERIGQILADKTVFKRALNEHYQSLKLGNQESYKDLIG